MPRSLRKIGRWLLARLRRYPPLELVYRTVRELDDDDATHMAAGVAYYAILSLFPLTIALLALLSPLLESGVVRTELLRFFQTYLPGSAETLEANIDAAVRIRGILGLVGLVGLIWTASAIFGAVSRAVNRVWDIRQDRPFVVDKLRHIAMAFGVGALFLLSLAATSVLQFIESVELPGIGRATALEGGAAAIVARGLPFVFSLTIFLLIYKLVPNTRTYWRYVWPGALLAAVLFETGKSLFVYYVDNFADYGKVYGSLGSVVVLLGWTYVSSLILIVGAEFSSEYGRMREGVARGRLIADADRERRRGRPGGD